MSAWTPGPWLVDWESDIPNVITAAGGDICDVYGEPRDRLANARLIAAAPEMAEALEKAAAQFEFYEQSHRAKGTQDGDAKAETNRAMAAEIHAILARIKGAS